jgi:hypothetical protein
MEWKKITKSRRTHERRKGNNRKADETNRTNNNTMSSRLSTTMAPLSGYGQASN